MSENELSTWDGFSTKSVSKALTYKVLGPTADYLGNKLSQYTQKSIENIERIFVKAGELLSEESETHGQVPPRILKHILSEGAFVDDQVSSSYLAGVLASSKSEDPSDDRGIVVNSLIARMSSYQLRMHYITYSAVQFLFRGTQRSLESQLPHSNAVRISTVAMLFSMNFASEYQDKNREFDDRLFSILSHCLYNLDKEGLISDWEFDWHNGFRLTPTPLGIELYLWAHGCGNCRLEYFFDKSFGDLQLDKDVPILIGNYELSSDEHSLEKYTIEGFYYVDHYANIICQLQKAE